MQNQVYQILSSLIPPSENKIAVAVSGGADSVALALLLREYCNKHNIELHATHVNHGLRPEAHHESTQVQQWLQQRNINTHILTPATSIAVMQGNLMQNARRIRYWLMQQYCLKHHINLLCVAHHMEDQAETFLMRLGRASGAEGLSAMQPQTKTQSQNITILRPLLTFHKAQLIQYLQSQNQPWIEDPTNHNPKYMRTQMRTLLLILAKTGISTERINQTTKHLARTADFLQQHTQEWFTKHCTTYPTLPFNSCQLNSNDAIPQITLPMQPWLELHEEIQLRILSLCLRKIQPHKPELRYQKLESLRLAMLHPHSFKGRTLHHCRIKARHNCYIISLEPLKN